MSEKVAAKKMVEKRHVGARTVTKVAVGSAELSQKKRGFSGTFTEKKHDATTEGNTMLPEWSPEIDMVPPERLPKKRCHTARSIARKGCAAAKAAAGESYDAFGRWLLVMSGDVR